LKPWLRAFRHASACILAAAGAGCEVRDELASPPAADWPAVPVIDARPLFPAAGATPTAVEYVEGYESGLRRAAEDGRPLLVVFRGSWCRWSAELVHGTLADQRIVDLSRRFVCVAVDADRDAATCRRFAVDRFPTVLLVDAAGTERFRVTGSTAAGLADAMAGMLAAPTARGRMAAGTPATAR
jgi:hypothetical protein